MTQTNETRDIDPRMLTKLARRAKAAGEHVVRIGVELFYALKAPGTPAWAKSVILGALAYFVLPLDAIPDFVPIAGYCDDLGVLATALATVKFYVTDDVRRLARERMAQWFGSDDEAAHSPETASPLA